LGRTLAACVGRGIGALRLCPRPAQIRGPRLSPWPGLRPARRPADTPTATWT